MGLPGWRRVTQGQQNNQGGQDLSSGLPCGRGHLGFSWATAAGTCFCCLPAAVRVAFLPVSLLKPPGQLPSSLSSINQRSHTADSSLVTFFSIGTNWVIPLTLSCHRCSLSQFLSKVIWFSVLVMAESNIRNKTKTKTAFCFLAPRAEKARDY